MNRPQQSVMLETVPPSVGRSPLYRSPHLPWMAVAKAGLCSGLYASRSGDSAQFLLLDTSHGDNS